MQYPAWYDANRRANKWEQYSRQDDTRDYEIMLLLTRLAQGAYSRVAFRCIREEDLG